MSLLSLISTWSQVSTSLKMTVKNVITTIFMYHLYLISQYSNYLTKSFLFYFKISLLSPSYFYFPTLNKSSHHFPLLKKDYGWFGFLFSLSCLTILSLFFWENYVAQMRREFFYFLLGWTLMIAWLKIRGRWIFQNYCPYA